MRGANGALLAGLLVALGGCAGAERVADGPAPAIAWAEWGPAPFARARAERKPILVHVVAGWCHWCHVMDRETYGDPAVARALERDWVTVRVDSDARPDLGERYRRWGWPASALLDPDARPLLVRRGYQEAGPFLALLERVREDLQAGRPCRDAVELPPVAGAGPAPAADLALALVRAREQLDGFYDPRGEGWGRGLQRYPLAEPLEHALLRARAGEAEWRGRALRTLAAQESLLDPAWGGLYQYSDDGTWRSPHYEKIPTVQAGALESWTLAFLETGDPRWERDARQVARFVLERLRAPDGALWASQDAEPPPSAGLAGRAYFALDAPGRERLGEPRVDRAVYADVNGLLARGLAVLGGASGDAALVDAARAALERLCVTHRLPGGAFTHLPAAASGPDPVLHLGDQVAVGRAALALHAASGEPRWLELARELAGALGALEDPAGGGFFAASADPVQAGTFAERRKPWLENAAAARFLLELAALLEDEPLRARAQAALRAQADPALVESWGRMIGGWLLALTTWATPPLVIQLVVPPAQAGSPQATALHRAALRALRPGRLLRVRAPEPGDPDAAPYLGACGPRSCSPPIHDPAELEPTLRGLEGPQ